MALVQRCISAGNDVALAEASLSCRVGEVRVSGLASCLPPVVLLVLEPWFRSQCILFSIIFSAIFLYPRSYRWKGSATHHFFKSNLFPSRAPSSERVQETL